MLPSVRACPLAIRPAVRLPYPLATIKPRSPGLSGSTVSRFSRQHLPFVPASLKLDDVARLEAEPAMDPAFLIDNFHKDETNTK